MSHNALVFDIISIIPRCNRYSLSLEITNKGFMDLASIIHVPMINNIHINIVSSFEEIPIHIQLYFINLVNNFRINNRYIILEFSKNGYSITNNMIYYSILCNSKLHNIHNLNLYNIIVQLRNKLGCIGNYTPRIEVSL